MNRSLRGRVIVPGSDDERPDALPPTEASSATTSSGRPVGLARPAVVVPGGAEEEDAVVVPPVCAPSPARKARRHEAVSSTNDPPAASSSPSSSPSLRTVVTRLPVPSKQSAPRGTCSGQKEKPQLGPQEDAEDEEEQPTEGAGVSVFKDEDPAHQTALKEASLLRKGQGLTGDALQAFLAEELMNFDDELGLALDDGDDSDLYPAPTW